MASSSGQARATKILVIEDEESIRRLMYSLLSLEGHEVHVCGTAADGLSALQEVAPDLVITDLGLPDLSGWEVARQVKKHSDQTPVILITGWGVAVESSEARRRGVDYFLAKPFEFEELTALIDSALARTGAAELGG